MFFIFKVLLHFLPGIYLEIWGGSVLDQSYPNPSEGLIQIKTRI